MFCFFAYPVCEVCELKTPAQNSRRRGRKLEFLTLICIMCKAILQFLLCFIVSETLHRGYRNQWESSIDIFQIFCIPLFSITDFYESFDRLVGRFVVEELAKVIRMVFASSSFIFDLFCPQLMSYHPDVGRSRRC